MKSLYLSIRKMMGHLNNELEQGGFWLPNIQRDFVWSEEQIVRLFDSIMREYPIGTLMVWKTKQKIKCRRFINTYRQEKNISNTYETINDKQKLLVLDGQQRLQSMFIALMGSYEGKELYLDVLGKPDNNDDIKYKFKFIQEHNVPVNYVKVKEIVYSNQRPLNIARNIKENLKRSNILVNEKSEFEITDTIDQLVSVFCTQELITYQELDSVDNSDKYSENDIVEIFIRANSGGTILEKSDLLTALLTVSVDEIEEKLSDLILSLNKFGYKFTRDYILKICLTLIGAGSKFEINKFRKSDNIEKIDENWEDISNAIKDVKDFIYGKTYLKCGKTLGAYNPLIPIIYLRYKYKDKYKEAIEKGLSKWLIEVIFAGAYSGSADSIIDLTIKSIDENKDMDFELLNEIYRNKNKSLEITESNILAAGYGTEPAKRKLYLLFNMWYQQFNFSPSFIENEPNVDHIFPQAALKKIKIMGNKGKQVQKYKKNEINQIGNCMLLTMKENQMGGKGDKLPKEWFKHKNKDYLKLHLIPEDRELWELDRFEDFILARNKLIVDKIKSLI
ncbi:MAG: GmrSD restriction endonuclease domain-containing protein [Clostridium sp.]